MLFSRLFRATQQPQSFLCRHRQPRPSKSRKQRLRSSGRRETLRGESLESRALLAVTAQIVGGDLQISLNAASDIATIASDGAAYTVIGTGFASTQFGIGGSQGVTGRIVVQDPASGAGQAFTVQAGTPLANPLQVDAGVESTTLIGGITTNVPGDVLIGSSVITLRSDIRTDATGADIELGGDVTLFGPVAVSTGTGGGDILFGGTLDGQQSLTLTAGTGLKHFYRLEVERATVREISYDASANYHANG